MFIKSALYKAKKNVRDHYHFAPEICIFLLFLEPSRCSPRAGVKPVFLQPSRHLSWSGVSNLRKPLAIMSHSSKSRDRDRYEITNLRNLLQRLNKLKMPKPVSKPTYRWNHVKQQCWFCLISKQLIVTNLGHLVSRKI